MDTELPRADLVTLSYVLGELSEVDQSAVLERVAGAAAELVVIVEPGTPAGYRRILAARSALLAAGLTVLAPARISVTARWRPGGTGATSGPG